VGQAKSDFNVLTWNLKTPAKKFTLKFTGSAEIYGIALDGDYGVAVDNIPLRGSSGTFFTEIDPPLMESMLSDLNVGLIILEFGGNMMPSIRGDRNVTDYKKKLSAQINYFKNLYPNAPILLIGPADMSTKEQGKLQTYPYLEKAVQGMKETALENGAAFWDMYQVMGGRNSMIKWVQNKPTLAAPDYIHFTPRGADRIARTFYESFMVYYNYYNFQRNHGMVNDER
jgi:lysophospholipase L1-like esterase